MPACSSHCTPARLPCAWAPMPCYGSHDNASAVLCSHHALHYKFTMCLYDSCCAQYWLHQSFASGLPKQ